MSQPTSTPPNTTEVSTSSTITRDEAIEMVEQILKMPQLGDEDRASLEGQLAALRQMRPGPIEMEVTVVRNLDADQEANQAAAAATQTLSGYTITGGDKE